MEVLPPQPAKRDVFPVVFYLGQPNSKMAPVSCQEKENTAIVTIADPQLKAEVSLFTSGPTGGHIKISHGDKVIADDNLKRQLELDQPWGAWPNRIKKILKLGSEETY